MLLQARIALYEGTWEKYHANTPFGVAGSDGAKFITKAKEVTDDLITLNSCEIDNDGTPNAYSNLFNNFFAGLCALLFEFLRIFTAQSLPAYGLQAGNTKTSNRARLPPRGYAAL